MAPGRIPDARHVFLGEPGTRIAELDCGTPRTIYCAGGVRAGVAESILGANGFNDVRNTPGSWKARTSAGYETETPKE
jgi:hydroxyacylglutathione hydrolase